MASATEVLVPSGVFEDKRSYNNRLRVLDRRLGISSATSQDGAALSSKRCANKIWQELLENPDQYAFITLEQFKVIVGLAFNADEAAERKLAYHLLNKYAAHLDSAMLNIVHAKFFAAKEKHFRELLIACPEVAKKLSAEQLYFYAKNDAEAARFFLEHPVFLKKIQNTYPKLTHPCYQFAAEHCRDLWLVDRFIHADEAVSAKIDDPVSAKIWALYAERDQIKANTDAILQAQSYLRSLQQALAQYQTLSTVQTIEGGAGEKVVTAAVPDSDIEQRKKTNAAWIAETVRELQQMSPIFVPDDRAAGAAAATDSQQDLLAGIDFAQLDALASAPGKSAASLTKKIDEVLKKSAAEKARLKQALDALLGKIPDIMQPLARLLGGAQKKNSAKSSGIVSDPAIEAARNTLKLFISAEQPGGVAAEQFVALDKVACWQNVEALIGLAPRYSALIDAPLACAMLSLVGDGATDIEKERFRKVVGYLLKHASLVLSNTPALSSASKYVITEAPGVSLESKLAAKVFQAQSYGTFPFHVNGKHSHDTTVFAVDPDLLKERPWLGKLLYEHCRLDSELEDGKYQAGELGADYSRFAKLLTELPKDEELYIFLQSQCSWLTGEHLLHIAALVADKKANLTAEQRTALNKFILSNVKIGEGKNRQKAREALRGAVLNQVADANKCCTKSFTQLLLNRFLRGALNLLDAGRKWPLQIERVSLDVPQWLARAGYDDGVCRIVANDGVLAREAFKFNGKPQAVTAIDAALPSDTNELSTFVKSNPRLAGIDSISSELREKNYNAWFGFNLTKCLHKLLSEPLVDQNVCLVIAENDRLWEKMVPKAGIFLDRVGSDSLQDKLNAFAAKSPFFAARLFQQGDLVSWTLEYTDETDVTGKRKNSIAETFLDNNAIALNETAKTFARELCMRATAGQLVQLIRNYPFLHDNYINKLSADSSEKKIVDTKLVAYFSGFTFAELLADLNGDARFTASIYNVIATRWEKSSDNKALLQEVKDWNAKDPTAIALVFGLHEEVLPKVLGTFFAENGFTQHQELISLFECHFSSAGNLTQLNAANLVQLLSAFARSDGVSKAITTHLQTDVHKMLAVWREPSLKPEVRTESFNVFVKLFPTIDPAAGAAGAASVAQQMPVLEVKDLQLLLNPDGSCLPNYKDHLAKYLKSQPTLAAEFFLSLDDAQRVANQDLFLPWLSAVSVNLKDIQTNILLTILQFPEDSKLRVLLLHQCSKPENFTILDAIVANCGIDTLDRLSATVCTRLQGLNIAPLSVPIALKLLTCRNHDVQLALSNYYYGKDGGADLPGWSARHNELCAVLNADDCSNELLQAHLPLFKGLLDIEPPLAAITTKHLEKFLQTGDRAVITRIFSDAYFVRRLVEGKYEVNDAERLLILQNLTQLDVGKAEEFFHDDLHGLLGLPGFIFGKSQVVRELEGEEKIKPLFDYKEGLVLVRQLFDLGDIVRNKLFRDFAPQQLFDLTYDDASGHRLLPIIFSPSYFGTNEANVRALMKQRSEHCLRYLSQSELHFVHAQGLLQQVPPQVTAQLLAKNPAYVHLLLEKDFALLWRERLAVTLAIADEKHGKIYLQGLLNVGGAEEKRSINEFLAKIAATTGNAKVLARLLEVKIGEKRSFAVPAYIADPINSAAGLGITIELCKKSALEAVQKQFPIDEKTNPAAKQKVGLGALFGGKSSFSIAADAVAEHLEQFYRCMGSGQTLQAQKYLTSFMAEQDAQGKAGFGIATFSPKHLHPLFLSTDNIAAVFGEHLVPYYPLLVASYLQEISVNFKRSLGANLMQKIDALRVQVLLKLCSDFGQVESRNAGFVLLDQLFAINAVPLNGVAIPDLAATIKTLSPVGQSSDLNTLLAFYLKMLNSSATVKYDILRAEPRLLALQIQVAFEQLAKQSANDAATFLANVFAARPEALHAVCLAMPSSKALPRENFLKLNALDLQIYLLEQEAFTGHFTKDDLLAILVATKSRAAELLCLTEPHLATKFNADELLGLAKRYYACCDSPASTAAQKAALSLERAGKTAMARVFLAHPELKKAVDVLLVGSCRAKLPSAAPLCVSGVVVEAQMPAVGAIAASAAAAKIPMPPAPPLGLSAHKPTADPRAALFAAIGGAHLRKAKTDAEPQEKKVSVAAAASESRVPSAVMLQEALGGLRKKGSGQSKSREKPVASRQLTAVQIANKILPTDKVISLKNPKEPCTIFPRKELYCLLGLVHPKTATGQAARYDLPRGVDEVAKFLWQGNRAAAAAYLSEQGQGLRVLLPKPGKPDEKEYSLKQLDAAQRVVLLQFLSDRIAESIKTGQLEECVEKLQVPVMPVGEPKIDSAADAAAPLFAANQADVLRALPRAGVVAGGSDRKVPGSPSAGAVKEGKGKEKAETAAGEVGVVGKTTPRAVSDTGLDTAASASRTTGAVAGSVSASAVNTPSIAAMLGVTPVSAGTTAAVAGALPKAPTPQGSKAQAVADKLAQAAAAARKKPVDLLAAIREAGANKEQMLHPKAERKLSEQVAPPQSGANSFLGAALADKFKNVHRDREEDSDDESDAGSEWGDDLLVKSPGGAGQ